MADFITNMLNQQIMGIPSIIFLVLFLVVIFLILKKLKPKGKEYKHIVFYKEVKKYLESLFRLQESKLGFGLPLMSGFNNLGFILKVISISYDNTLNLKDNLAKEKNKAKYKELEVLLEKVDQERSYVYCFKLCHKGILKQFLANAFSFNVKYLLADKEIVNILPMEIQINPIVTPKVFADIYFYSKASKEIIEDIAFKSSREQELQEIVNFIPKQTFLEVQQSKDIQQLKEISDIKKKQRKEMIEELTRD